MKRLALASAAAAAVVALQAPGASIAAPKHPSCPASGLKGTFSLIRGSAGAGHVGYALKLTNRGSATCTVSGRPRLQLLDSKGRKLPTHVTPLPGPKRAVTVTLAKGKSARADARFSPDIPSGGEPANGPCEPQAVRVRVTLAAPAHGSLVVPVRPPTSVCERGGIQLTALRKSK
jgi:hypothetical protein